MNIWESLLVTSIPVSIFHGIDPALEMAEYLDVLERRMDRRRKLLAQRTEIQYPAHLKDILEELEYLCDIRKRKTSFDPILNGIIEEKLSQFMQEAGEEVEKDNISTGAVRMEELRRQAIYLTDLSVNQQAGNPVLQRLIAETLKGYYSLRALDEEEQKDNGNKTETLSLDGIRDAKVLTDDETARLYYMAEKALGRDFDRSEPFPLEMVLAAENLRIHQKRVFFEIWLKASERISEKPEKEDLDKTQEMDAGIDTDGFGNTGAEEKCICVRPAEDGTAHAKITHFKLIDYMNYMEITAEEYTDFSKLVKDSKVAEDDEGFYSVEDILSSNSISVGQKAEFMKILRKLQGPKRSSANAEPYNRNPVGNNPLSSPEEFRRIIDSDGISDQDVSDLVRLMCKSAPGSCLKDVLRSRYLSADEKEEIRDIIDRALKGKTGARLKPGKITDACPHSSDRKNKKYVIIVTTEEPDYFEKSLIEYYSENPARGILIDIVYGDNYEELTANGDYEGLFYFLYEVGSGKRLGYGCISPDIMEELRGGENA
ncbi:hypothetical protein CE91St58_18720 [Lachnospiraceae bacterium]|nr:hypothetical protein CE91St56_28790 [Lachnospiraceae bacterium]GKH41825.1 hypothetical protein CE91St57_27990 [Lachnospiraceae bacterium]GKH54487.1 hypothetical protein CE91St58_18720 [Lachnospiraceae bacterium]